MKNKYLNKKIKPYNPRDITTVEDALIALQGVSFQGRNLGRSLEVLTNMIKEPDCLRVLTMSGALIPAGMDEIICQCIEKGIIGAIVSTGANIIHSLVNSFEENDHQAHYSGSSQVDDQDLYEHRINRIYDTFLPEEEYKSTETKIETIIKAEFESDKQYIYSPSEFLKFLGKKIPGRCFVKVAAEHNIPIFCGATSDSELALDLLVYRVKDNFKIILDEIEDVRIFGELIRSKKTHGTIILGGGVPRNWAQQIFPLLDQMYPESHYHGYKFSVRFHSAVEHDGGLSGCTISESVSWGKYDVNATAQSVWGDSTVYFPLLMTAMFQRMKRKKIIPT